MITAENRYGQMIRAIYECVLLHHTRIWSTIYARRSSVTPRCNLIGKKVTYKFQSVHKHSTERRQRRRHAAATWRRILCTRLETLTYLETNTTTTAVSRCHIGQPQTMNCSCRSTHWLPDTSAPRHFGPAWDTSAPSQVTSAPKNVVRDTSASDRRKVGTLWKFGPRTVPTRHSSTGDSAFGLKLVTKCPGAEMSCGRSVRLPTHSDTTWWQIHQLYVLRNKPNI